MGTETAPPSTGASPAPASPEPNSNKIFAVLLVVSILVSVLGTWTLLNKADQLPKGEIVKVIKTGPKISLFINKAGIPAQPNVEKISKASQVSMVVAPSQ